MMTEWSRALVRGRGLALEDAIAAAKASGAWHEHFGAHMKPPPIEFALSDITRSGRVDFEDLCHAPPDFVAACEASRRR